MARPIELTDELLEKARGYLPSCVDSYRKANQPIWEDAMGNEIQAPEDEEEVDEDGPDPLYKDARDAVRAAGSASTSHLQRTLHIGYSRASRLMDLLEEHCVIAEADGSKPRALLPEEEELPYEVDEEDEFGGMKAPEPIRRLTARRTLWEGKSRLKVELPSVAGFARYLGIARSTIYEWKDKETEGLPEDEKQRFYEFSDITEQILAEQEYRLINKGISGEYNGLLSKLLLTKHGYSDKTDITSGGERITPTPEQQAKANAVVDSFLKRIPTIEEHGADPSTGTTSNAGA